MRAKWFTLLVSALALSACAHDEAKMATPPRPKPVQDDRCTPSVHALESRAGQQWLREHGWRYKSRDAAEQAYLTVVDRSSPWPDWFAPQDIVLPVGTRMQMALSPDQPADKPGGYATFDRVSTLAQARDNLAIRTAWKPALGRIAVYEVVAPMPARIGPIASQIDPATCRLLIGRWSQIEFRVPYDKRMDYLVVVDEFSVR